MPAGCHHRVESVFPRRHLSQPVLSHGAAPCPLLLPPLIDTANVLRFCFLLGAKALSASPGSSGAGSFDALLPPHAERMIDTLRSLYDINRHRCRFAAPFPHYRTLSGS